MTGRACHAIRASRMLRMPVWVDFGRSVGELRAVFSGARKESRVSWGQVVFVKEGQIEHELYDI
jgi:hypothetical protein